MTILSIDTSCDETAASITSGRKVLANVIYSQVLIHKKWGGVVPSLAKRAHEERIDFVIQKTFKKFKVQSSKFKVEDIDYIAVTQGPGLAVALEVGIKKAKELAVKYHKKLISVNHLEGHIYSPFVQNAHGNPKRDFHFPYLVLIASGGHTEFVIFKNHLDYEVIGRTIDDAAGEALDKAAKILNLGYPGGPVIERLAQTVQNQDQYHFPRPMHKSQNMDLSFSGLKTAFYYFLKKMNEEERLKQLNYLASSFQEAVFNSLIIKTEKALEKTGIKNIIVGGGVIANFRLRKLIRDLAKKHKAEVFFPAYKYLTGDNAAMIGVVGYYKALANQTVKDISSLDRIPRLSL